MADWTDPTPEEWAEACEMAEAVHGGKWDKDYTEMQKRGWVLCVRWARARYAAGQP